MATAATACGGGAAPVREAGADVPSAAEAGDVPWVYEIPVCPDAAEAPLRQADGGPRCVRVGADPSTAAGAWPDATDAATPVAYVGDGATPGGARAHADLAAALAASPRPATILMGRGTFRLPGLTRLSESVTIRGMGGAATVLVASGGATAFEVDGASGGALEVTLARLELHYEPSVGAPAPAVRVTGASARLTLRDVAVVRGGSVVADGNATLCARGLSVLHARAVGVLLTGGSEGYLRDLLVRDGADRGVQAERAHVDIERALIADNVRDGVTLRGIRSSAAPCSADRDCARSPACPDLRVASPDPVSRCLRSPPPGEVPVRSVPVEHRCRDLTWLSDVAVIGNGVTGVRAERTLPEAGDDRNRVLADPGPVVRASGLVIAATVLPTGLVGGDGLYVGPSADVVLDPSVPRDAGPLREAEFLGLRSEIVRNARSGVLLDGDRIVAGPEMIPADLLQPARLDAAGALIGSNGGPGVFVQRLAQVSALGFSRIADNTGIGIGVGGGRIAALFCDQSIYTRRATLRLSDGRSTFVGDGLSLVEGSGDPIRVAYSTFSDNGRFGVIFSNYTADMSDHNAGAGNEYGVGAYNGASAPGFPEQIRGRTPAPPSAEAASAVGGVGAP